MANAVRFWVDPICPWCWVTARWVNEIAPERDLSIVWEPISLFYKNEPSPDSKGYEPTRWTLGLLRVMESVRAAEGEAAVGNLYVEYGRRIHHDESRLWDPVEALRAVELADTHAAAADDPSWDDPIRERMDEGLALVGADVGTPIIAVRTDDGREVALFGPVISRVPATKDALALWDSVTFLAGLDDFWELKRTRTRRPDPGDRP
jgi:predicted DsbA family dithiol-disulfide isomerase